MTLTTSSQRLTKPLPSDAKAHEFSHFTAITSAKRHRTFSHQPDFAHLHVRSERHADERAQEDRS